MPELRIGTSGYQYNHWRDVFYPTSLKKDNWFDHYAETFDTVEINSTFYAQPKASTFEKWHDRAPRNFRYALKFSRFSTHIKRLVEPEAAIDKFLDGAERLKSFLGPILVQLPPHWNVDPDRLSAFLNAAPSRHRWTVEFRDPSWLCREVYEILRGHNAALCMHDMITNHPDVVTTDWVYLRFHGRRYTQKYTPEEIASAARRIRGYLDQGLDVYAYFNNDTRGYAVENARELGERLTGKGRSKRSLFSQ